MTPEERQILFNQMSRPEGKNKIKLTMKKEPAEIGNPFTPEEMDDFGFQVMNFIGARIMGKWNGSQKVPHLVEVEIKVKVI